jgi:hypothetical protein
MKEKYYNDLFGGKKYGEYMVYGLDKSESKYSDYSDLLNQIGSYYNVDTFQEESEEQKAIREAKEKAQKRNNKIDQILGE